VTQENVLLLPTCCNVGEVVDGDAPVVAQVDVRIRREQVPDLLLGLVLAGERAGGHLVDVGLLHGDQIERGENYNYNCALIPA